MAEKKNEKKPKRSKTYLDCVLDRVVTAPKKGLLYRDVERHVNMNSTLDWEIEMTDMQAEKRRLTMHTLFLKAVRRAVDEGLITRLPGPRLSMTQDQKTAAKARLVRYKQKPKKKGSASKKHACTKRTKKSTQKKTKKRKDMTCL